MGNKYLALIYLTLLLVNGYNGYVHNDAFSAMCGAFMYTLLMLETRSK